MNIKTFVVTSTVLILSSGAAWPDDDAAESTIRLMGAAEAESPDVVTKEISLPEAVGVDSAAVENAAKGLPNANENKQRREKGLTTADEARERGAEMSDQARDNRENRGRSEDRPQPPTNPGPPSS
jgi:hypothetical protein